ncbi:MAG: GldG family protein [Pseudomonadota bacterium]|nr:GldG family protein [Pseudomonadota bacterium]
MRAWRERADAWLFAALLIVGAACIALLSARYSIIADWSAGARASLAPESRAILAQLRGPVQATSYARSGGNLRTQIATFVERYQRYKLDLKLTFVDPDADPALMRKQAISVDGEIVLRWHDREQRIDQLDERSFNDALARLTRSRDRLIAFVTGDGERNANGKANADLGEFIAQLSTRGIRALPMNLAQSAGVPRNADLVVLASPQAELAPTAVQALRDWLDHGGNLLWLTEPDTGEVGLTPLAQMLGMRVLPGTLVDGTGAAFGLGDPRLIVETVYPPQAITHGFKLNTLYPQVAALAVVSGAEWASVPILSSGAQSWNQIAPVDPAQASTIKYDASLGELRGPLDFGLALTRLSPSPDKNEQRAVVIGDGDFLSNSFLGNGGNRALGERVVDWLLNDDALVGLPPRGAPDRALKLTQLDLDGITWGFLIALPLLLLATGIAITWRRRRR